MTQVFAGPVRDVDIDIESENGDVFDNCRSAVADLAEALEQAGVFPYFRALEGPAGPRAVVDGRPVIMLGSNNYLGLADDPRVRAAGHAALDRFGSGCTGSRLLNGTTVLHREMEEYLADWLGTEACLVITTGYGANLAAISGTVGPADRTLVDAAAHASMLDGRTLSRSQLGRFRHNDVASLTRRLRTPHPTGGTLVAVDGLYSMEGDFARLEEFAAACRGKARLLVDEAHSLGVAGSSGAGAAESAGVRPDIITGTFSKSLASCGGFIAAAADVIRHIRVAARPFLFTASGVPAALGAGLQAAKIARTEDWRRDQLASNGQRLRNGLSQLGFSVGGHADSPIVPVHIGNDAAAIHLWSELFDRGVYVNCAIAPAVPARGALLRASVIATHTDQDIDDALSAFADITPMNR